MLMKWYGWLAGGANQNGVFFHFFPVFLRFFAPIITKIEENILILQAIRIHLLIMKVG